MPTTRDALTRLFRGTGTLVRGYTAESIAWQECARSVSLERCAAFDRLLGTRMAVADAELRLPLDRLAVGGVALEVAPFVDAGLAWRAGDAAKPPPERCPARSRRIPRR